MERSAPADPLTARSHSRADGDRGGGSRSRGARRGQRISVHAQFRHDLLAGPVSDTRDGIDAWATSAGGATIVTFHVTSGVGWASAHEFCK